MDLRRALRSDAAAMLGVALFVLVTIFIVALVYWSTP
jgi:hypothetical protein